MTPLRQKRPWYLRPLPLLGMVTLLLFVPWFISGKGGVWHSYRLHRKYRAQAEQIRVLEIRKQQLEQYLAALKKGDELALERAAREQDFAGAHETIYEIRVEKSRR